MLPGADGIAVEKDRLHRVDDQQAGFDFLDVIEDPFQRGFADHQQIGRFDTQTLGAHFDLPLRFFAGDIEASDIFLAYRREGLQQQSRLADAGIAADENHRSLHQPAAQHPVKLADPRKHPALFCHVDIVNRRRFFFAAQTQLTARRCRFLEAFLGKGVPLAAIRAFAQPLGRLKPATLTGEDDFGFGHSNKFAVVALSVFSFSSRGRFWQCWHPCAHGSPARRRSPGATFHCWPVSVITVTVLRLYRVTIPNKAGCPSG